MKIKSISKIPHVGKVYNLAVEQDESYIVNKIVVHNCRSLLVPILSDEQYQLSSLNPEAPNGIERQFD